jgi:type IV pilus assembly protein PilZ
MTSKKSSGKGKSTGTSAQPANAGGRAKKTTPIGDAEGAGADGRLGRRIPIQLLVDYKSEGNYLFDFCKDLGAGGVFIQTTKPLTTGSTLDLTFTIPDSKETLTTKGRVIWVQNPVAERKDLTPGMGVQFDAFSVDQRKILDEFVQRYHGEKLAAVPTADGAKRAG